MVSAHRLLKVISDKPDWFTQRGYKGFLNVCDDYRRASNDPNIMNKDIQAMLTKLVDRAIVSTIQCDLRVGYRVENFTFESMFADVFDKMFLDGDDFIDHEYQAAINHRNIVKKLVKELVTPVPKHIGKYPIHEIITYVLNRDVKTPITKDDVINAIRDLLNDGFLGVDVCEGNHPLHVYYKGN